jgi:hypothetical protein
MSGGPVYFVLADGNRNIIADTSIGSGSDGDISEVLKSLEIPEGAVYFGTYPFSSIDFNEPYDDSRNEGYSCNLSAVFNIVAKGKDGITPHIGANGNWWIGETDTGVKAEGKDGEDYVLTDADKAEIAGIVEENASDQISEHNTDTSAHADIREQISQLSSEIVDEIAVMTQVEYDAMTKSRLQELYAQGVRLIAVETSDSDPEAPSYTNQVPLSVDVDGVTIYGEDYNGDGVNDGYLAKTRLNSSGVIVENTQLNSATGYIKASSGDVIRIKGVAFNSGGEYLHIYNSAHTSIGYVVGTSPSNDGMTPIKDGILTTITLPNNEDIKWIRVSLAHNMEDENYSSAEHPSNGPGSYMIVTVNQEIKEA